MGLWLQAGVGSLSHTSVLGGGSWSQSGKLKACGVFAQSALHKERGRGSRDGRAKASRQCQRPGEARGHPGLKNFGWRPILLTFQFWTPDPVVQRE